MAKTLLALMDCFTTADAYIFAIRQLSTECTADSTPLLNATCGAKVLYRLRQSREKWKRAKLPFRTRAKNLRRDADA
jgi:hypothetical protein